jgi:hypothetical protein
MTDLLNPSECIGKQAVYGSKNRDDDRSATFNGSQHRNCLLYWDISGKKLISLKPIVRIRRSYKRAGLKNGKNLFKD